MPNSPHAHPGEAYGHRRRNASGVTREGDGTAAERRRLSELSEVDLYLAVTLPDMIYIWIYIWPGASAKMSVKKPKKQPQKPPKKDEAAGKAAGNKALTAQNRKLLGKHYANKYRTGRGG